MAETFRYIMRYSLPPMIEHLSPDRVHVGTVILSVVMITALCLMGKRWDKMMWVVLAETVFLVVYTTTFFRECSGSYAYELSPLWSYRESGEKFNNMILEVILNVLMFVPIGFMAGLVLRRHRWYWTLVFGVGVSVSIELLQLVLQRGLCETDDVIHNTLGCAIGFGLCRLVLFIKRQLSRPVDR